MHLEIGKNLAVTGAFSQEFINTYCNQLKGDKKAGDSFNSSLENLATQANANKSEAGQVKTKVDGFRDRRAKLSRDFSTHVNEVQAKNHVDE